MAFRKEYLWPLHKYLKQPQCQQKVLLIRFLCLAIKSRSTNGLSYRTQGSGKCFTLGRRSDRIQAQIQVTEKETKVILLSQAEVNHHLHWFKDSLLFLAVESQVWYWSNFPDTAWGRSDYITWYVECFGDQSQLSNEQTLCLLLSQLTD